MSNEVQPSEIDFSEVFTDTSVLFDYALGDDCDADTLFDQHSSTKVVSKSVKREFNRVYERREKLHQALLKLARQGELEQFDPPGDVNLTSNDWGYVEQLLDQLFEIEDDAEVVRRLNEKRRQLKNAKRLLFEASESLIHRVCSPDRDPMLKGYLQMDVENTADVRIICEVVQWTLNGGSGTFLTSDSDDILSNSGVINKHIQRYDSDGELTVLSATSFIQSDQ